MSDKVSKPEISSEELFDIVKERINVDKEFHSNIKKLNEIKAKKSIEQFVKNVANAVGVKAAMSIIREVARTIWDLLS